MEKIIRDFFDKYIFFVIFLLSLPAVAALLAHGFYGASDDIHIAWLFEMDRSIKAGQIPPRFVPDLSFGFGYPLFNFVFPLPFYIGEVFHVLGMSLVDSIKSLFFLSIPLSALLMYFLLSQKLGKILSLAGAVMYIYTPYRAMDLYIRGAIGEILSFVFLPLLTLSVVKVTSENPKFKWIGIGALSEAALILTHNITAYMFFPCILLLAFLNIYFVSDKKIKSFKLLIETLSLGFITSLYFWLPAMLDSSLMKYDTVFNFRDHFPTFKQLFTPFWGYGASVPGPNDGLSFSIGTVSILVSLVGIFLSVIFWKRYNNSEKVLLIWASIVFIISILMMNFRSVFLWESLPFLPYFQFPWRFLILTTFISPIFLISFKVLKVQLLIGVIIICSTILFTINFFKPHDFLGREDTYFLNRYIPEPIASPEYLQTQEEYLRLPKNTQMRPDRNYSLIFTESTDELADPYGYNVKFNINQLNSLKTEIGVSANAQTTLVYGKYLFPGWQVLVDGKSVALSPDSPFGRVRFNIPQGSHKILVYFTETPIKIIFDIVSCLGLILALLFIFQFKFRDKVR